MRICFTGQALIRSDLRGCQAPGFLKVRSILESADHVFTNLEGAVRGRFGGWPTVGGENFPESDPVVLDCLREMGIDLLSLANNHSCDIGPAGVLSTIEEVKNRGFVFAGTGVNKSEALEPGISTETSGERIGLIAVDAGPQPDLVYATDSTPNVPARPGVNQLKVQPRLALPDDDLKYFRLLSERLGHERFKAAHARYGFKMVAPDGITYWDSKDVFNFFNLVIEGGASAPHGTAVIEADELAKHVAVVRDARAKAETVIVYLHSHHWQPEFSVVPDWIVRFAHAMIDAGATAFVAHGMPQLHGIEIYKGCPIFYSLGNFIFHLMPPRAVFDSDEVWESLIAVADIDPKGRLHELTLEPIVLTDETGVWNGQKPRPYPTRASVDASARILDRVEELSRPFGTRFEQLSEGRARIKL